MTTHPIPDPRDVSQDAEHPISWPRGLKLYDRCVLTIEALWPDGSGLATVHALVGPQQAPKRYQVLVRQGVPGDTVLVQIEAMRRNKAEAHIVQVISPSPRRIPPRCVHFGRREIPGKGCGGCIIQSLSYEDQLAAKQQFALGALEAEGLLGNLGQKLMPVIGVDAPNQWFYRNKMEFSFGDYQRSGDLELGLHPRGFKHDVLPLSECFLLAEFIPAYLTHVVQWARSRGLTQYVGRTESGHLKHLVIRQGKRTGECLVDLVTISAEHFDRDDAPALVAEEIAQDFARITQEFATSSGIPITSIHWTKHHAKRGEPTTATTHHLHGAPMLWEQMHLPDGVTLDFHIHPRAFFQPNTLQAEHLYALILQLAGLTGHCSPTAKKPALALDLYCGTGTIALALAKYIDHVIGVELRPEAVENAVKNAQDNQIENATFFAGDVADVLGSDAWKAKLDGQHIDLVVVDPPRAGLSSKALDHVDHTGAHVLVYVSCEPKSLARDIRKLQANGWTLDLIQPIDMFPHTRHLEQVARLQKTKP